MKILENPNPAPTKEHVCEKCQCKFEFTPQDVTVRNHSDANGRIGGTHYYGVEYSVVCPNCGNKYIIKNKSGYHNSACYDLPTDNEVKESFEQIIK